VKKEEEEEEEEEVANRGKIPKRKIESNGTAADHSVTSHSSGPESDGCGHLDCE